MFLIVREGHQGTIVGLDFRDTVLVKMFVARPSLVVGDQSSPFLQRQISVLCFVQVLLGTSRKQSHGIENEAGFSSKLVENNQFI